VRKSCLQAADLGGGNLSASTQLIDVAPIDARGDGLLPEPQRPISPRAIAPADRRATLSAEVDPAFVRLLGNRLVVIGLLAVAGPLGLPALWLSRRFSKPTKIATTVLFFLATVVAPLALAYYWLEIALRPLVDVFDKAKL
jgi:hypothetical protein